jgi:Uri superfamily endonuclease
LTERYYGIIVDKNVNKDIISPKNNWMCNDFEIDGKLSGKGVYVLLMKLEVTREINIGRLGLISFRPGGYAYVGSAMGSFKGRLGYHLKKNKKQHWHIDYLLESAVISDVLTIETEVRLECAIARALGERFESIPGFGSSDCQCKSHLFFAPNAGELRLRATEILNLLAMQLK